MRRWLGSCLVVTASHALAACQGSPSHQASGTTTGPGTATGFTTIPGVDGGAAGLWCPAWTVATPSPSSGDVTGTAINQYYRSDGSTVTYPSDLSGVELVALVASAGQWLAFPGKGQKDGSFVIPGVPQGRYLLTMLGFDYLPYFSVSTSARVLDLGQSWPTRPDVAATKGTALTADLQDLAPWTSESSLWFGATSVNPQCSIPDPIVGDTSLHVDAAPCSGGHVDASKGDLAFFTQYLTHVAPAGVAYTTIDRIAIFSDVTFTDGALTTISGAFAPAPATESVDLDFRATQFASLAQTLHPQIIGVEPPTLDIGAAPGLADDPLAGGLLSSNLLNLMVTADAKLPLTYANPFSAAFTERLMAWTTAQASVRLPGLPGASVRASTSMSVPASKASAGPIVPILGPVQDPRVNGLSAFGGLTGVTATPTLSWKAPALGTPDGYLVSIDTYVVQSGSAMANDASGPAFFVTTDTELTLPPCSLSGGDAYVVTITALSFGVDLEAHPNRTGPEIAWTDLVTDGLTP